MGRQRVPKGAVIPKKEDKVLTVLSSLDDELNRSIDFETFLSAFQRDYPKDWKRVCDRYEAHERLTKPGKSHPMAPPAKYMENTFRQICKKLRDAGQTPSEYLAFIRIPRSEKPAFVDGEPPRLGKVLKGLKHPDFERRREFVNRIGKYRCEASIDALSDVMASDFVYDIRLLAYEKLVRFGVPDLEKPTLG